MRNAEGEFELVLGNKQLLSMFFLVVVLFAVFFSLGFFVGKSSSPGPGLVATLPAPAAGPIETTERPSPIRTKEAAPAPALEAPPVRTEPAAAPVEEKLNQAPRTVLAKAVKEEIKPAAAPVPAPKATPPAPKVSLPPPPAPAAPSVNLGQMHLQLAAVRVRGDGEALVESLRKKGYRAQLHAQTRDGWMRVVIGPFADEKAAREMKARLEKDGYKSILKKPAAA